MVRSGAAQAMPATPTTIAATAIASRRPGLSPRRVAPSHSSRIRPLARHGCTTVSGASSSAAISSGHPASPRAVAPSQRRFRTSRPSSEGRSACSCDTSRASSACSDLTGGPGPLSAAGGYSRSARGSRSAQLSEREGARQLHRWQAVSPRSIRCLRALRSEPSRPSPPEPTWRPSSGSMPCACSRRQTTDQCRQNDYDPERASPTMPPIRVASRSFLSPSPANAGLMWATKPQTAIAAAVSPKAVATVLTSEPIGSIAGHRNRERTRGAQIAPTSGCLRYVSW